jgi:pantoate--beta-alanine ligase
MRVLRSGDELRRWRDLEQPAVLGFVPTMGALHEGHLSLLRRARDLSDRVVMSIFVNPTQFGPGEDFEAYPRDEARDLALAETEKVDAVFLPTVEEIYPSGATSQMSAGPLGERLEGASRPGHFDGVATVVAKLFDLVRPQVAFFGEKDAQQVAVVRQLVRDLGLAIEVVACPTVREPDGLALSSRNAYLSPEDRHRATVLWRALETAAFALACGSAPEDAAAAGREVISLAEGADLDYLEAVDPETFEAPQPGGDVLFVVAARVGATRLIDNQLVRSGAPSGARG